MSRIQIFFNKAWHGLKSQEFSRCVTKSGRCRYRDDTGKRCAWGWVDEEADYQAVGVGGLSTRLVLSLTSDERFFAAKLQNCHDVYGASGPEAMEANLRSLAAEYNLTVPGE